MTSQRDQEYGYETATAPSRRLTGLGVAIAIHAILLYGLTSGLGREVIQKVQKTVSVAIIELPKPPPPPPPPPEDEPPPEKNPKPQIRTPKAWVPPTETEVKEAPDETEAAITSTSTVEAEATPLVQEAPARVAREPAPPTPRKPKIVSPRLKGGCSPPQYPRRSLDKGEEGLVVLKFLIGLDGAVKQSVLVQSSGFSRLDEAAKSAFSKCRFIPGKVNGAPAPAWVRQPFRWQLQ